MSSLTVLPTCFEDFTQPPTCCSFLSLSLPLPHHPAAGLGVGFATAAGLVIFLLCLVGVIPSILATSSIFLLDPPLHLA